MNILKYEDEIRKINVNGQDFTYQMGIHGGIFRVFGGIFDELSFYKGYSFFLDNNEEVQDHIKEFLDDKEYSKKHPFKGYLRTLNHREFRNFGHGLLPGISYTIFNDDEASPSGDSDWNDLKKRLGL